MAPRRRARPAPRKAASHVRRNLAFWERTQAWYDGRHAARLDGAHAMAWGHWRIPESQLQLLGPVRGRDVLEVACGAARWSIALARRGARSVGIDLSPSQLRSARALRSRARVRLPLVRGNVEALPFRDRSFDVVFSDWGAFTFADPERVVPECARVLRPGGRLAFAATNPWREVTTRPGLNHQSRRLLVPYFGTRRLDFGPGDSVEFTRTFQEWFELFARSGFAVERLIEPQPSRGARSSYLSVRDERWARSWPIETLWQLRRAGN